MTYVNSRRCLTNATLMRLHMAYWEAITGTVRSSKTTYSKCTRSGGATANAVGKPRKWNGPNRTLTLLTATKQNSSVVKMKPGRRVGHRVSQLILRLNGVFHRLVVPFTVRVADRMLSPDGWPRTLILLTVRLSVRTFGISGRGLKCAGTSTSGGRWNTSRLIAANGGLSSESVRNRSMSNYRWEVVTSKGRPFSIHKDRAAADEAAALISGTVRDYVPNDKETSWPKSS